MILVSSSSLQADSTGAMQSLEWYQASDGEDMIRPVAGGTGGGTAVAAKRATGQWDQWGVSEADIAHRNNGSGDGGYNGSGVIKASSEIIGRGGPAIRAPASLSTSNPPPSRFTREGKCIAGVPDWPAAYRLVPHLSVDLSAHL